MRTSLSASVSRSQGANKATESYAFYVALTDTIMGLVERMRRSDPAQLRYGGMDLSHAFEAMLYFAGVHDPGLVGLHENPQDVHAARLLEGSPSRLLARNGFGQGPALRLAANRDRIAGLYRMAKRAMASRAGNGPITLEKNAASAPLLFFARSPRFARYFRPFADRLTGRCAFLVPGEDQTLRAMPLQWGHPVLPYQSVPGPHKTAGRMLLDYAPHLLAFANGMEQALAQSQARLVVVLEGNSPEDEIVNRVAHKLGRRTACLQQGWSPIVHPGFRNLSYDELLVWGEGFAELLAPYNRAQHFTAVGNHQLRLQPAGERSGVLFCFQAFEKWLGGAQSAEAMLSLAERVADGDAPVYLRPHPVAPFPDPVLARLSRRPNIRIEPPSQVELAEAFAKARISVSTYSTTILESAAAGTVPVIFNTTTMPRYWPDVDAAGAGLEIRDIDTAESTIRRLLTDPVFFDSFTGPMASFAARFFKTVGPAALTEVETVLLRLAKG
jgi:hypothetical protein